MRNYRRKRPKERKRYQEASRSIHRLSHEVATERPSNRSSATTALHLMPRMPLKVDQAMLAQPHVRKESNTQNIVAASFLNLPAEIRNQIYDTVFHGWIFAIRRDIHGKDCYETDVWSADTDPYLVLERRSWPITNRSSIVLGLLYTCRQIHAETKHLPYSLSTVLCGDRTCPRGWKDALHPQLSHARTLQLCTKMPANIVLSRVWLEFLPQFKDVKKIEIHWQLHMPAWGSEEDHLSTAAADEIDMRKKVVTATSAACEVTFHRTVVGD